MLFDQVEGCLSFAMEAMSYRECLDIKITNKYRGAVLVLTIPSFTWISIKRSAGLGPVIISVQAEPNYIIVKSSGGASFISQETIGACFIIVKSSARARACFISSLGPGR